MKRLYNWMKKCDPTKMVKASLYFQSNTFEYIQNNLTDEMLLRTENEEVEIIEFVPELYSENKIEVTKIPISFSIVNDYVIEHDSIMNEPYNRQNPTHRNLKPYFLEFTGFLKEGYENDTFIEYAFEENQQEFYGYWISEEKMNEDISRWIETISVFVVLEGELLISASPVRKEKGKLILTYDKAENNISSYIDKLGFDKEKCNLINTESDFSLYTKEIVQMGLDDKPVCLSVYNVGQGCCTLVVTESGKRIFVDVGESTDLNELNEKCIISALKKIKRVKADTVILTHWDLDHILGVSNIRRDILNKKYWIVPGVDKLNSYKKNYLSNAAKRLMKYLTWKNGANVFVIDDKLALKTIHASDISLLTGKRSSDSGKNSAGEKYTITPANNFGLIVDLHYRRDALITGDCCYRKMPARLSKKEYDVLVIPHHCSKMSSASISAKSTKGGNTSEAVASYGKNNTYGHPDDCHKNELIANGFMYNETLNKRYIDYRLDK